MKLLSIAVVTQFVNSHATTCSIKWTLVIAEEGELSKLRSGSSDGIYQNENICAGWFMFEWFQFILFELTIWTIW